jgi:hypothetical protein
VSPIRALVALAVLLAAGGEAAAIDASSPPDFSRISLEILSARRGASGPEAEAELHNDSDQVLFFAGYSASSPAYTRQCVASSESSNGDMGWCGNGLEAQTVDPGQRLRFTAKLCLNGDATKIGLTLSARQGEAGETLWSQGIPLPQRSDSDPMPVFDEFGAGQEAFRHLRETGAIGALGKTWKMEKPRVAGFQVKSHEATNCVSPGDYVLVQYEYVDKPADGPNSIVYELLISRKLKWVGDLTAMSRDEAIAAFRAGAVCKGP